MQAHTTSGRVVRLALAAVIFFGIILGLLRIRSPVFIVLVNFLPVVLIALPILGFVLWSRRARSMDYGGMDAGTGKPKRGESLGELMSILNDEDIDDLRARVKARLEEQIDHANAEEIETFADLLGEMKEKRG